MPCFFVLQRDRVPVHLSPMFLQLEHQPNGVSRAEAWWLGVTEPALRIRHTLTSATSWWQYFSSQTRCLDKSALRISHGVVRGFDGG